MDAPFGKAEETLGLLQQIVEVTPDFVALIDENGTFLYVNRVVSGLKRE